MEGQNTDYDRNVENREQGRILMPLAIPNARLERGHRDRDDDNFQMGDDPEDFRLLKDVVHYELDAPAKGGTVGIFLLWIALSWPRLATLGININPLYLQLPCVAVFALAAYSVVTRPDVRIRNPGFNFNFRITQLLLISGICMLLDVILENLGYSLNMFYFKVKNSTAFATQLETFQTTSFTSILETGAWLKINCQFFVLSFSLLFVLDIPFTIYRIVARSPVHTEILIFELCALVAPTLYLLCGFWTVNLLSWYMPPSYHTKFTWLAIYFLLFFWLGVNLAGVWYYPEIPINRPMGIHGYVYMESVTLLQIGFDVVTHSFFVMINDLYFNIVPGAFEKSWKTPGFVPHAMLFHEQIGKKPYSEWVLSHPFTFNFDVFHGLLFVVFIVRYLRLNKCINDIQERLDRERW